jgi:hypothetical protein
MKKPHLMKKLLRGLGLALGAVGLATAGAQAQDTELVV